MAQFQKTLADKVSISGVGLHSGVNAVMNILPAPEDHGFKFKRIDLVEGPVIDALIENVVDTSRGTTIESSGVRISTVEHVLAALYGMGIDNALIEINAQEVPILDGSAIQYVKEIERVGVVEQTKEINFYEIKDIISFSNGESKVEIIAFPSESYSLKVVIDYNSSVLISQFAEFSEDMNFAKEIASCRTFVFLHELEYLLANDQIKGGDINNAIVIIDRNVKQEEFDRLAKLFNKPKVEAQAQGILNNVELNFTNEPARHKLLDLMGDLALIGLRIKGKIIAERPGHTSNIEFAKKVKQIIKKEASKNTPPRLNFSEPPVMDINKIKKLLPHRPPFLLVDKILDMTENTIVGLKNVTMNEGFFVGHFPDEPVMPGVLQIEAMAQVGGLLVLNSVPDPENYSTYFLKIENVKFKRKVVPGDTLIFSLEFVSPLRRGIANMKGIAFVGDNIVMEGEMMAQIVKNR